MTRIILALAILAIGTSDSVAQQGPFACYNPTTGDVSLNQLDGAYGITIHVDDPNDLLVENHNAEGADSIDTFISGEITWANYRGFFDTYELGRVIRPTFTPIQGLRVSIITSFLGLEEGVPIYGQFLDDTYYYCIPEPASAVLLSGILLLVVLTSRDSVARRRV